MKNISLFTLIILSGCATTSTQKDVVQIPTKQEITSPNWIKESPPPPKVHWFAVRTYDEFTDERRCKATVGSTYTNHGIYTETGKFYPYVEQVDGQLRVGVMSGGNFRMMVGPVQIRIDANKSWDILTSESPLEHEPNKIINMEHLYDSIPEEQREKTIALVKNASDNSAKFMLPYTATTGKKAKLILDEMINGNFIKYRRKTETYNASNKGEYLLDESFLSALQECSISY